MSYVTSFIVVSSLLNRKFSHERSPDGDDAPKAVDHLNDWLEKKHGRRALKRLDGDAGGNKHFLGFLWAGAINYLDLEFEGEFKRAPWKEPGMVQLLIRTEDDEAFRIVTVERRGSDEVS